MIEPKADVVRATSPLHVSSPAVTPGRLILYGLMITIWGSSFFFTSLALDSFTPLQIVFIRMLIATAILGAVVLVIRPGLPRRAAVWGHFVFLGILSIALPYSLLTWAQVWVDSSVAIVLSSTTPIFVFLIATLVLHSETFDATRLVAILIAFGGVILLTAGNTSASTSWTWSVVIVGTSIVYAIANLYTRHFVGDVHPLLTAFLQLGFGTLWLLPVMLFTRGWQLPADVRPLSVVALLELGVLGSAFGYVLFFHFIRTWGSTKTSLNTYLQPVVGITLGVGVLGERPGWPAWVGSAVVLIGLALFGGSSLRRQLTRHRRQTRDRAIRRRRVRRPADPA
ncbi:MAG: EamA family transporter [Microlunatus sp.]